MLIERQLLAFALCLVLFQLSNAAMLPLAGTEVTRRVGDGANLVIAACLVVPQAVVAWLSPWMDRLPATASLVLISMALASLLNLVVERPFLRLRDMLVPDRRAFVAA